MRRRRRRNGSGERGAAADAPPKGARERARGRHPEDGGRAARDAPAPIAQGGLAAGRGGRARVREHARRAGRASGCAARPCRCPSGRASCSTRRCSSACCAATTSRCRASPAIGRRSMRRSRAAGEPGLVDAGTSRQLEATAPVAVGRIRRSRHAYGLDEPGACRRLRHRASPRHRTALERRRRLARRVAPLGRRSPAVLRRVARASEIQLQDVARRGLGGPFALALRARDDDGADRRPRARRDRTHQRACREDAGRYDQPRGTAHLRRDRVRRRRRAALRRAGYGDDASRRGARRSHRRAVRPVQPGEVGSVAARFRRVCRRPGGRTGVQACGNVLLVQGAGACVPCMREGCDQHVASYSDCLLQMPSSAVIAAAERALAAR